MRQPGSKSKSGPVTVRTVTPWTPAPRTFIGWDGFGNPTFRIEREVVA